MTINDDFVYLPFLAFRPCRDQRVDRGSQETKKLYVLNAKISLGGREAFNRKADGAKLISDRLKPDKEA